MVEVDLVSNDDGYVYFLIDTERKCYYTSKKIADLFNLTIDQYNNILIEKIIEHNKYSFNNRSYEALKNDVTFKQSGTSKEVYLDRFKEAFAPQLTLLALGGDSFES